MCHQRSLLGLRTSAPSQTSRRHKTATKLQQKREESPPQKKQRAAVSFASQKLKRPKLAAPPTDPLQLLKQNQAAEWEKCRSVRNKHDCSRAPSATTKEPANRLLLLFVHGRRCGASIYRGQAGVYSNTENMNIILINLY